MKDLLSSINAARSLDELLFLMAMLSRRMETMMSSGAFGEADVQGLVGPLAMIRSLLTTLSSSPVRSGETALQRTLARALADRYGDIEGQIKEMRNDMVRSKRTCTQQ